MPKTSDQLINRIVKGSSIVFIGSIISLLLGFLSKVIFIRYTTQDEYGIYSLSLSVILIFTVISNLGLQEGTTRYIAYFRGKDREKYIQATILSSVISALIASFFIMGFIILISNFIATDLFRSQMTSKIIKILSITIPFTVLSNIYISIYRGYNRVDVRVVFENILKPSLYIILLISTILLKLSFLEMIYAYVISVLVIWAMLTAYIYKYPPTEMELHKSCIKKITRKLLKYSIPLLAIDMLFTLMSWTDTIMLGYFKTPEIVGAYNAAYPIANLLSMVINSIGYIYVPIASQLYSKNNVVELGKIHINLTKWCFILTVPIFFIIFIFPGFVLNTLFGISYIEVNKTLQILALGFLINSFFGFNYYMLLSTGKSNLLMNCSILSAVLNIILNLVFIPKWSMEGAAIASLLSYGLIEVYMTINVYNSFKIHPFTINYLKTTIIFIVLVYIVSYINVEEYNLIDLTTLSVVFYLMFILLLYLTKSFDSEDMEIIHSIKTKLRHTTNKYVGKAYPKT